MNGNTIKGLVNSREEDQIQFIVSTKGVKIAVGNKGKTRKSSNDLLSRRV